jgi:hypothetical protein
VQASSATQQLESGFLGEELTLVATQLPPVQIRRIIPITTNCLFFGGVTAHLTEDGRARIPKVRPRF